MLDEDLAHFVDRMLRRLGKPPDHPLRLEDNWLPSIRTLVETLVEKIEALENRDAR